MFKWLKKTTELKPMHSSKLEIACLGKLPMQAEFIRHQVSHPVVKAFEQWLQNNFVQQGRSQFNHGNSVLGLAHGFILASTTPALFIGYLQDSTDQSGREYPIAIMRELPITNYLTNTLPIIYQSFFQGAQQLIQQNWLTLTQQDLTCGLNVLLENPALVENSIAENLVTLEFSKLPFNIFWQQLNIVTINSATFLYSLEKSLKTQNPLQIKLPILSGSQQEVSISFWLQLISTIKKPQAATQCIFWQKNFQNKNELIVHNGELNTNLFNFLMDKPSATVIDPINNPCLLVETLMDDYTFDDATSLFDVIHFWANLRSAK